MYFFQGLLSWTDVVYSVSISISQNYILKKYQVDTCWQSELLVIINWKVQVSLPKGSNSLFFPQKLLDSTSINNIPVWTVFDFSSPFAKSNPFEKQQMIREILYNGLEYPDVHVLSPDCRPVLQLGMVTADLPCLFLVIYFIIKFLDCNVSMVDCHFWSYWSLLMISTETKQWDCYSRKSSLWEWPAQAVLCSDF